MTGLNAESNADVIRKGSKSFAAAARLFDKDIRDDVHRLYAWCRHCDDQIDGEQLGFRNCTLTGAEQERRLERIRELTRQALDGEQVSDPAFRSLREVVERHDIPHHYPLELIEGFAMDVGQRHYRTLDDTLLYCYHVAGVVGVMMSYIMGIRDARIFRRAADLGIAFQLTNIARDVMDDAANGRVYLPAQWLEEEGIPPEQITDPALRNGVFRCVLRLLAQADRYYESARDSIGELPLRCAWAVSSADRIYHSIGTQLRSCGPEAWDERLITPGRQKLYWVLRGGFTALRLVKLNRHGELNSRAPDLWAKADLR